MGMAAQLEASKKGQHICFYGDASNTAAGREPILGRTYRTLTGGDLCEERIDISRHTHDGHPSSVKVRTAIGVSHCLPTPYRGRQEVSKVMHLAMLPRFQYNDEVTHDPASCSIKFLSRYLKI